MGIYRGPGGSGDAVNDSSSETRLAVEARDAALAAQAAAEAAQAAAETAETNAETAETNAETAETNAETAATNAASSASAASTSASNASSSASSASTSATNAASSASSASSSASAASTSATNAATSATNAANSATAAATSETNASNSATAAASSASSASSSASTATTQASNASTSATNAASSATSAASSASTATTQAGLASTSATNAANSASAASTSATNASNSASAASTSASNAATSATNAASSATAASSAQSAAEAARDATLAAYDSFDDRYLGTKTSDPTLDNDGNALVAGALYFNSTDGVMKLYTGSIWTAAYVSGAGVLLQANNLSDLSNVASARTNLGVTATGSDTTYAYRANNLSDLASASTARTNLGLGTAATTAATDYATAAQGAKADTALQSADIGVSVQGYDADTAKLDVSQSWSAAQSFNAGVTLGDASGDALTINSSAVSIPNGLNFDSNTLVIDATNNRVGVGTASPDSRLHINTGGNASTGGITLRNIANQQHFWYLSSNTTSTFEIGSTSGTWTWVNSNGERMRITSTGNVGIGTTSPVSRISSTGSSSTDFSGLTIRNADGTNGSAAVLTFEASTGTQGDVASSVAHIKGVRISSGTTGALSFWTTNAGVSAERMRLDSSGNLGLGVTPSAWFSSGYKTLQNGWASFFAGASNTSSCTLGYNTYTDTSGVSRYIGSSYATYYEQYQGQHAWYKAASGTAGNAITFTQAMTLNASGQLQLGTTSEPFSRGYSRYLAISGSAATALEINAGTGDLAYIDMGVNGTRSLSITTDNSIAYFGAVTSIPVGFVVAGTERMRIDSSGNVGIGTSSTSTTAIQPCLFIGTSNTGASYNSTVRTGGYSSTAQLRYTFNHAGAGYGWGIGSSGGSDFIIGTVADYTVGSVSSEKMRIDSSGNLLFNSGYGSVATAYGCRAWVNFNGTGTVAIRASGNVSSITDNGTGNYTINFTNALSDANYSVIGSAGVGGYNGVYVTTQLSDGDRGTNSTSATQIRTSVGGNSSAGAYDSSYVYVAIFR